MGKKFWVGEFGKFFNVGRVTLNRDTFFGLMYSSLDPTGGRIIVFNVCESRINPELEDVVYECSLVSRDNSYLDDDFNVVFGLIRIFLYSSCRSDRLIFYNWSSGLQEEHPCLTDPSKVLIFLGVSIQVLGGVLETQICLG